MKYGSQEVPQPLSDLPQGFVFSDLDAEEPELEVTYAGSQEMKDPSSPEVLLTRKHSQRLCVARSFVRAIFPSKHGCLGSPFGIFIDRVRDPGYPAAVSCAGAPIWNAGPRS